MKKILILQFILLITTSIIWAQSQTMSGIQLSTLRYMPDISMPPYASKNSTMKYGWGWSAGVFIQKNWKAWIKPIAELNYYRYSSDIYLEYPSINTDNTGNGYGYGTENENISIGNYPHTTYNQIALSGGVKLNFNKLLYAYPAIEFAYPFSSDIQISKGMFNLRLGLGYQTQYANVILDYSYGLQEQLTTFTSNNDFTIQHKNRFLQLKIQIPIYAIR